MRNTLLKMTIAAAAGMLVLVMADASSAQRSRNARGRKYTKAQVGNVIKRAEERADNFVDNFDASLDNSGLDGSAREDKLMKKARRLENATDELRREFDRSDSWIENKSEVRNALNIAHDIDRTMKNRRFGKKTESNWVRLRYELNTLAKIYKLPSVGSRAYN
jgi:hypothetical protein